MYNSAMSTLPRWRLLQARSTACPPQWSWDSRHQRWTGSIHLWVVAGGRGSLESGGRRFTLAEGDCFALRIRHRQIASQDPKAPLLVHAFSFDVFDARGSSFVPDETDLPIHRHIPDFGFFGTLCRRAVAEWRANRVNTAGRWLAAIQAEIARLDRGTAQTALRNRPRQDTVDALLDRIHLQPGAKLTLPWIATHLGVSQSQARRIFRSFAGAPPRRARTRARIEAAEELLACSDMTVKQIADRLGYCDAFAFSRHFKKHTGLSPAKHRQGLPSDQTSP